MPAHLETRSDYVAGIDGLRAIAVLSVIIFHFNESLLPGGFTGVDVFFVISGFVISKSIAGNLEDSFVRYLSEFYKRRLLRILPALVVCLAVTGIVSSLFIPGSWLSSQNADTGTFAFLGLSNYSLVSDVDGYFSERVPFNPFVHTWSLAVEEQFYLVFPLLLFLWLKPKTETSFGGILLKSLVPILGLVSLTFSYFETSSNPQHAFYLLPSRFWELAVGAILYQLHSTGHLSFGRSSTGSFVLSLAGVSLLILGFSYSPATLFPFPWALAPVCGTALLLISLINVPDERPAFQAILGTRYLAYTGKISYSLYLWHWPVFTIFRWTVGLSDPGDITLAAVLVLALSAGSFHLIETPIRRSRALGGQPARTIILGSISMIAVAATCANIGFPRPWLFGQSVLYDDVSAWTAYSAPTNLKKHGFISEDYSKRTLFVIGDSHTNAYAGMLKVVSAHLGINVESRAVSGCPIMSLMVPYPNTAYCRDFVDRTMTEVEARSRPGDIIFFASLRANRLSSQSGPLGAETIEASQTGDSAKRGRREALGQAKTLVERVHALGLHVLIDTPKPVFRAPPFRCADWFNRMNNVCAPGFSISRDFLLNHNRPALESLAILEEEYPFIHVWDAFSVLCKDSVCSAFDNGRPLFFDGDHLSGFGNQLLVPSFESEVRQILDSD